MKNLILQENKDKSGIYRWSNNVSKNTYIGSAVDLSNRLNRYYHMSELIKKNARPINQALLKYGHENFSLEILEYCSKDDLLSREDYYFELLKPEYNILKHAYSLLGYKHTAESLNKMRLRKVTPEHKVLLSMARQNRIITQETRDKLSAAIRDFRKNNPLSEKTLEKLKAKGIKRQGVAVTVLNTKTNEVREYNNKTEAGAFLGVSRQAITLAIKRKSVIKKIYVVSIKD